MMRFTIVPFSDLTNYGRKTARNDMAAGHFSQEAGAFLRKFACLRKSTADGSLMEEKINPNVSVSHPFRCAMRTCVCIRLHHLCSTFFFRLSINILEKNLNRKPINWQARCIEFGRGVLSLRICGAEIVDGSTCRHACVRLFDVRIKFN